MSSHTNKVSANPDALSARGVFWYDPRLKDRARELRKNGTSFENKMWKKFLSLRPLNSIFVRQKPIGYYILDFYCSELLLAVEIDGPIHDMDYDGERDAYLSACGIRVMRIKNEDIVNSFDFMKIRIIDEINSLRAKFSSSG